MRTVLPHTRIFVVQLETQALHALGAMDADSGETGCGENQAEDIGGRSSALLPSPYGPDSMMANRPTKVLLVDDHPLFREGLATAIQAEPDLEIVAQAGNAEELRAVAGGVDVDLAVVDVLMPSVSGIGITRELRQHAPGCR